MRRCPFCEPDPERVIARTENAYAMFSLWPASKYHTLIIPSRHVENETRLTPEENAEIFELRAEILGAVSNRHRLRSYNYGVNVGDEAGQTVPHLHYHVIFRTHGDSPDPIGGIRNVVPGKGNYHSSDISEGRKEVMKWTREFNGTIQNRLRRHVRFQHSIPEQ